MLPADYIPREPEREEWDVIVIGTGMGGSTVGYELARRGRRVLFLEKGKLLHGGPEGSREPLADMDSEIEARLRAGRWPHPLEGKTTFGEIAFIAPWGTGTGGSTAIYGAQLERFTPADFEPRANFPDVRDANLPERWPITYDELAAGLRHPLDLSRERRATRRRGEHGTAIIAPLPGPRTSLPRLYVRTGVHPMVVQRVRRSCRTLGPVHG